MVTRFTSVLAIASMLSLSVAQAASNFAEISQMQGKVLVNQGDGFVALNDGSALKAGDQIMVGKHSGAVLSYNGGCEISINEAKVVTVAKAAPCKVGKVAMADSALISPVADPIGGEFPLLPVLFVGGGALLVGGFLLLKNKCATC